MAEFKLPLTEQSEMVGICGRNEEFVRIIRKAFKSHILTRGMDIVVSGEDSDDLEKVENLFKELYFLHKQGISPTEHDIRYAIKVIKGGGAFRLHEMYADVIVNTFRGNQVKAKTLGQQKYINAIRKNYITLGIGPAGTGKTYLAVAMAVAALKSHEVERIILTRPVVEAGEKLGFLPGDLQDKVDPYLRPLYDGICDVLGYDTFQKSLSKNLIEVAPLAYMRGRTLNNAFVILDEAQNTSPEQMKMFLTRFGFGSKMVITGDITQIDLPSNRNSGLREAAVVLGKVDGISVIHFGEEDVVRHAIVGAIIKAYEEHRKERSVGEQ